MFAPFSVPEKVHILWNYNSKFYHWENDIHICEGQHIKISASLNQWKQSLPLFVSVYHQIRRVTPSGILGKGYEFWQGLCWAKPILESISESQQNIILSIHLITLRLNRNLLKICGGRAWGVVPQLPILRACPLSSNNRNLKFRVERKGRQNCGFWPKIKLFK